MAAVTTAANELYNQFNMQLIGWWVYGQESLSSSAPLAGPEDLVDWKFRSPPGLETEIFAELGASPIVMDFTEIFTALETGIIDGADASGLANNVGLGLYDLVDHATYPGFHSMPSDHLAIRKDAWDASAGRHPAHHRSGDAEAGLPDRADLRGQEQRGGGRSSPLPASPCTTGRPRIAVRSARPRRPCGRCGPTRRRKRGPWSTATSSS